MMLPCRVCGVPPETRRQSRSDARIAQKQSRSTIRAGTTASIATRCASITASTTSTIASASLFNTRLGAPQSVLLRHNENHGGDADGGCSAPTARHVVHRPSCAGTSRARLRCRFFCLEVQQVNYSEHRVGAIRVMAPSVALPNWQRQTNLWRKATNPARGQSD